MITKFMGDWLITLRQLLINYLKTINLRKKVLKLVYPACLSYSVVFKEKSRLVYPSFWNPADLTSESFFSY